MWSSYRYTDTDKKSGLQRKKGRERIKKRKSLHVGVCTQVNKFIRTFVILSMFMYVLYTSKQVHVFSCAVKLFQATLSEPGFESLGF